MNKTDLKLLVNNIALLDKDARVKALVKVFNDYGSEVYKLVQAELVNKLKKIV